MFGLNFMGGSNEHQVADGIVRNVARAYKIYLRARDSGDAQKQAEAAAYVAGIYELGTDVAPDLTKRIFSASANLLSKEDAAEIGKAIRGVLDNANGYCKRETGFDNPMAAFIDAINKDNGEGEGDDE